MLVACFWLVVSQAQVPAAASTPQLATPRVRDIAVFKGREVVVTDPKIDAIAVGPLGRYEVAWAEAREGWSRYEVRTPRGPVALREGFVMFEGIASDRWGAVVWGTGVADPEGPNAGVVQSVGLKRWFKAIGDVGFGFRVGALSPGAVGLAAGSPDGTVSFVVLDRATGAERSRWVAPAVGEVVEPIGVFAEEAGWRILATSRSTSPSRGGTVSLVSWQVGRDGKGSAPSVLVAGPVEVSEAARSPDGALWLVASGGYQSGTWTWGLVGRWTATGLQWRAEPRCRAVEQLAVDGDRLFLAGTLTTGAQPTGWLDAHPLAAFDSWSDPSACLSPAP